MSGTPSIPTVPAGASATTKILVTVGAILGLLAAVTWPTGVSPAIGQYSLIGGYLSGQVALIIHAVWDHTP